MPVTGSGYSLLDEGGKGLVSLTDFFDVDTLASEFDQEAYFKAGCFQVVNEMSLFNSRQNRQWVFN